MPLSHDPWRSLARDKWEPPYSEHQTHPSFSKDQHRTRQLRSRRRGHRLKAGVLEVRGSGIPPMWIWGKLVSQSLCFLTIEWDNSNSCGGKEPACKCRRCKRRGFDPWVRKIPWRRAWLPTPVFLPEESHGQRSLAGYSP